MKIVKRKILSFIYTSIHILILMLLAIWMFWEGYFKDYVEDYIDRTYGYSIKETYNNSELIKKLLNYDNIGEQSTKKN